MKGRAANAGLVLIPFLFFTVFMVGLDWPSASASLRNLRQAYPGQQVRIVTFKTNGLAVACGFYVLGGRPDQLRYLQTEDGLTAERTPNQWPSFEIDQPYQDEWQQCRSRSSRGHAFDFVFDPLIVALLRLS